MLALLSRRPLLSVGNDRIVAGFIPITLKFPPIKILLARIMMHPRTFITF